jgi:acyl-CoA thioesterase FadM
VNLWFRLLWVRLRSALSPSFGARSRVTLWDEVRTPFRVVPTDLDVLRHMNNARYLALLDLGRLDLMLRCGFWAQLDEHGWYPVVSAQTITYKRSLTLGQRFVLVTRVLGFDERAGYMEQTFLVGDTVSARAVVQARFLRKAGGTVPQDELAAAAGGYPEHLELPSWVHEWAEAVRISSVADPA